MNNSLSLDNIIDNKKRKRENIFNIFCYYNKFQ